MHQINVSVVGVAVSDVRAATTDAGYSMARFRLVCRPRRFDGATGTFTELEPSFLTVLCWRQLADHVAASVHKGDQVVVTGRMRVREWEQDGRVRVSVEVDAQSVGLDLTRAPAILKRHLSEAPAMAGPSGSGQQGGPSQVERTSMTVQAGGEPAKGAAA